MRPRINPWWFLVRLVAFLIATYFLWAPLAPAYAKFLLRASRVGVWLTELTVEPAQRTQLLMNLERSPTAIFFYQPQLFPLRGLDPQGIPAEWVMANLVLLVPLMLATPSATWWLRIGKLLLALAVALVLQVADIVVGIKSFYASNFPGLWGPWATEVYQFLDAFFQSWDTQLFPFAIWAGINFRQLLPERLFAAPPQTAGSSPLPRGGLSRAERRRRDRAQR
jgi:hypothetical protein